MKVNLDRAKAGSLLDIGEEFYAAYQAGASFDQAANEVLANRIIERYRGHIAAALRSKGIEIADTDTLDATTLLTIINARTGLTISEWSPDAVKLALDAFMAGRLSDVLGVEVASVQDVDGIKQSLIDSASSAVQSGRPNAFMSKGMIKKIRQAKAWRDGGVPQDERRATLARWYQKKFRRTHKSVWQ
jgi:hypothetical protein